MPIFLFRWKILLRHTNVRAIKSDIICVKFIVYWRIFLADFLRINFAKSRQARFAYYHVFYITFLANILQITTNFVNRFQIMRWLNRRNCKLVRLLSFQKVLLTFHLILQSLLLLFCYFVILLICYLHPNFLFFSFIDQIFFRSIFMTFKNLLSQTWDFSFYRSEQDAKLILLRFQGSWCEFPAFLYD